MAKPNRASEATGLEHSPSHLLHRAVQLALDLYAAEADPDAATPRQYAVLSAVAENEGLSQTGLVRATGIDRSTLADMVSRMIGKGLIARARSKSDARANAVRLTEDGRLMLERTRPFITASDQRLLKLLGSKKRDPFVAALRRLSKAGEAALLPQAPDLDRSAAPEDEHDKPKKGGKIKEGRKKKTKRLELSPAEAIVLDGLA